MLACQSRSPVPSCSHGHHVFVTTSGLGAHTRRGAGVYPCARRTSRRAGGYGSALAGHRPAIDRAVAARLAHVLAAPVERPAAGDRETAAPCPEWASTWRTAWSRGAGAGLGAGGASGRGDCRQAGAVPALSASVVRRGSPAPAPSSDRGPAGAADDDRIPRASPGLREVWRSDPGGGTAWGPHRRVRPTGAGDRRAVHGGVSPVQTHHPERPGGSVWPRDESGDHGALGARHRPGRGRACGRRPGLWARSARGAPGRHGMARRGAAGLAVDGGHGLGHRVRRAAVAPWSGGPGAFGGALLGRSGDGSLERLYLVSELAAAARWGASAARHRSHARARGTLPRAWRRRAGAGPPHVSLVASRPRGYPRARTLRQLYAADPARGGALARRGPDRWRPENRRDVSGDPHVATGVVDVRPASRSRADQPCR